MTLLKTEGITLTQGGSEDEMFIGYNSLIGDDQVMVEQVEKSVDEQDEGTKDAEISDNNNNLDEEI